MAHTLIHSLAGTRAPRRERRVVDDPLDPIRGILVGVTLSVLVFWLPVALALTQ